MESSPNFPEVRRLHLDAAGRVLIPASLRQQYGLAAGEPIVLEPTTSGIVLRALDAVIRDVQAFFAEAAPAEVVLSEELIRERREETVGEAGD